MRLFIHLFIKFAKGKLHITLRKVFARVYPLIYLFLIVTVFDVNAQPFRGVNYDTETGLPTNLTKRVIQDDTGFIWVATDVGIVRFDGRNFVTYIEGLPSLFIKDFLITRQRELLAVTDMGICRLEGSLNKYRFTPFIPGHSEKTDSTLFYPKSVYESKDGTLWISENNAVVRFSNGQLTRYPFDKKYASDSFARAFLFFEDNLGRLITTSEKGYLFSYDLRTDAFREIPINNPYPSILIHAVLETSGNRLLIGGANGLFELPLNENFTNLQWQKLPFDENISDMVQLANGDIFITSWLSGLYKWQPAAERSPEKYSAYRYNVISDIYVARDSSLWVCSDDGLTVLHPSFFSQVSLEATSEYILATATEDGETIYATEGLSVFTLESASSKAVTKNIYHNDRGRIASITVANNVLWVGNNKGVLSRFENGVTRRLAMPQLGTEVIESIAVDKQNRVWMGINGFKGLVQVTPDEQINIYDDRHGINSVINVVKAGDDREIYAGGSGEAGYLYRYNPTTDKFENLSQPLPDSVYAHFQIFDFDFGQDGVIWLASSQGVLYYQDGEIHYPSGVAAAERQQIKAIAADIYGNVWLGTAQGLFRYSDAQLTHFDTKSGLPSPTISFRTLLMDSQNRLWVGTSRQLARMRSTTEEKKQTPIPIFTNIVAGEKEHLEYNNLTMSFPSQTTIVADYASLTFPADKVKYRYRIPGKRDSWSNASYNPQTFLTEMPAGDYKLEVAAQQTGYLWSEPTIFTFSINNPFYASWWAILIYLLVAAGIAFFFMHFRQAVKKRRKAELYVDSQRSFYEQVLGNIDAEITVFDKDLHYQYINPKAVPDARLREWLIGKDDFAYCLQIGENIDVAKRRQERMRTAIIQRKIVDFDDDVLTHSGEHEYYIRKLCPIFDKKQKVTNLVSYGINITHRKIAEEALKKAKETAEMASRAKSEFLANMSHEIRTPLNGVLGMNLLLLESSLNNEQQEYAETIQQCSETLLTLINEILDLSKIEAGRLELESIDFEFARLIEETAHIFLPTLRESGIFFRLDNDTNLPKYVTGDPTRIRQVLMNLLGNATKFTRKGHIAIRTECLNTPLQQPGSPIAIKVFVSDTGIGIPEEKQRKIFDSFSQADGSTSRKYGGTGLGLTISQQLVKLMKGEMGVESEEGQGATFWFTMQLREAENADDFSFGDTPRESQQPEELPLNILLAEDNTVNQRLAKRMLEKRGHKIDIVSNGQEAIDAVASSKYDVVLMDMQMPEMDGLEATQIIRRTEASNGHHIPIIALTANAMKRDRDACLAAGMDAYISKPINPEKLFEEIRKLI